MLWSICKRGFLHSAWQLAAVAYGLSTLKISK